MQKMPRLSALYYHHFMLRLFTIFLLLFCSASAFALSQDEVVAGAEQMYRKRMTELQQRFMLDDDADFLTRVERVLQPLLRQAKLDYPASAAWRWEIHTSSEPDETAYCMAGGKLLVSQNQVLALNLNDAELAMLLSHEMQHALQQHNLKEYLEAMRLFPVWKTRPFSALEDAVDNESTLILALSALNLKQEGEADIEGMKLAWRAGWRAHDLAQFFKKLARSSSRPNFDSASHPASGRRWQVARELAATLDASKKDTLP
ncbi:MAG: M48 family metalloprotease [Pseudomonadota bacterium]